MFDTFSYIYIHTYVHIMNSDLGHCKSATSHDQNLIYKSAMWKCLSKKVYTFIHAMPTFLKSALSLYECPCGKHVLSPCRSPFLELRMNGFPQNFST